MPPAGKPTYTLRSDLVGVRALPLLQSAADFDKLDGKLQAKIAVRSTGGSQRAIMSNLERHGVRQCSRTAPSAASTSRR